MSDQSQDHPSRVGVVLPFEKPKKKPAFQTIPLDELKKRMQEKGVYTPFDKHAWKKQVSKQLQGQKGNPPSGGGVVSDEDLIRNIRELQEVCRILSSNLKTVHVDVENRLTDMEGHLEWLENQTADIAKIVHRLAVEVERLISAPK